MLKRSLLVRVVKDPEPSPSVDYDHVAKLVTKNAVICIVTYVGADTLRRLAVYAMSGKYYK